MLANQELSEQDQALVDEAVNDLKEAIAALDTAGTGTAANGDPAATTGASSVKIIDAVSIGMADAAPLLPDSCTLTKKRSHC